MSRSKCIIILSEKSSGSSACQNLLTKFSDIRHVSKTRHFENETLYWTKAASALGLEQLDMIDSEVPIDPEKARQDLVSLLTDNLDNYSAPEDISDLVFDGWNKLCKNYAPIFLEKSPHHLLQWSAIELIIKAMGKAENTDYLIIGLVRNPMDILYSQFTRWRTRPENLQQQWYIAYKNLLKLKNIVGDKLVIVRYEDIVSSLDYMKPIFEFCETKIDNADQDYLHSKALSKWKKDKMFGFSLSKEVIILARNFGYKEDGLVNDRTLTWPVYRESVRLIYKFKQLIKKITGMGKLASK